MSNKLLDAVTVLVAVALPAGRCCRCDGGFDAPLPRGDRGNALG